MSLRKTLLGVFGGVFALFVTGSLAERAQASPVTIYVATNGVFSRTRLQAANSLTPVNTINRASQLSEPGDTIEVAPGTYIGSVNIAYRSGLLIQGKAGAAKPVIKPTPGDDYAVVKFSGSDNITFTGFEVDGTGAGPNVSAVIIVPRTDPTTHVITPSHHIAVKSCKVHDAGSAGIITNPDATYTIGCDYITISGNEVYNCVATGIYGGSAISLLMDQDTTHTAGYHSIIQNNIIHDNVNVNQDLDAQGNIDVKKHTDGNGIIIDTTRFQGPKVLVQNNIVYRNGGRGIHVFYSSNVDVLNNTVYGNNLDPYLQPSGAAELEGSTATNVFFSNNVVQGNGLAPAFRVGQVFGTTNGTITFKNTTYTGCSSLPPVGNRDYSRTNAGIDWASTIFSDPSWGSLFVNASTGDFHLRALATRAGLTSLQSQTALNRGSSTAGAYAFDDFNGVVRMPAVGTPPGGSVDKGAYEQSGEITVTRAGYRYQRSNGHVFQTVILTAIGGDSAGPVSLVLDNLTGATLVGATGITSASIPSGSPYVNTLGLLSDTTRTVTLEFTAQPNNYTTRVLVGNAIR